MASVLSVTLDTNCFNTRPDSVLDEIHALGKKDKITLHKTDTADLEIIGNTGISEVAKERLKVSEESSEDKGSFVLGHSRTGHARVGTDKVIERLQKSSDISEDNGPGLWGHFRWGHGRWSDGSDSYIEEIKSLVFPDIEGMDEDAKKRALRDCIHLSTHKIHGRDFFVTKDKRLLKNACLLKKTHGIQIVSPENFLRSRV
jgi:predicted nucleic acid-binding protein